MSSEKFQYHNRPNQNSHYRRILFERYFSVHYSGVMPSTVEGWEWAIERIDLNLRSVFDRLKKEAPILDIGCGVGYLPYYLVKNGFSRIVAIDVSDEQISVARDQLRKFGVDYEGFVKFYVIDSFQFLGENRGFDIISMMDVLDHFDKESAFRLMELSYLALNSAGFFLIRTTNMNNPLFGRHYYKDFTHESGFTPDSITQCLKAIGFKEVKVFYEKIPLTFKEKRSFLRRYKRVSRRLKLRVVAKILGIHPDMFSEDIVAIARK